MYHCVQVNFVEEAFRGLRQFLVVASKSKEPSQVRMVKGNTVIHVHTGESVDSSSRHGYKSVTGPCWLFDSTI